MYLEENITKDAETEVSRALDATEDHARRVGLAVRDVGCVKRVLSVADGEGESRRCCRQGVDVSVTGMVSSKYKQLLVRSSYPPWVLSSLEPGMAA